MPDDREERRAARAARIAARRLRVQSRRERVQARREAAAATREAMALPPGLRRVEGVATEIGTAPKDVEATRFGKATNVDYIRIVAVESSWVSHVMLILDRTTGVRRLAVRFLDGYACFYSLSTEADYIAMLAAPSKGKHIWSHWYGQGKRKITAATSGGRRGPGQLAEAPGTIRVQGKRRRRISS